MPDMPSKNYLSRDERLVAGDRRVDVELDAGGRGVLIDISRSGLHALFDDGAPPVGSRISAVRIRCDDRTLEAGAALVRRTAVDVEGGAVTVGLAFEVQVSLDPLRDDLGAAPYVTGELAHAPDLAVGLPPDLDQGMRLDFGKQSSADLMEKCRSFATFARSMQASGYYQALYRVTLTSPLDHCITVFNPIRRCEQAMICFDSNSYLGLHLHPRVTEVVKKAIDHMGYGTPSAQLLSGTNRYLRELEEVVAQFHGREDALVFSTGNSANVGTIAALVGPDDLVAVDRFSHASIHDGARHSRARFCEAYPYRDVAALEKIIAAADGAAGKLIVTDGVFSMHGSLAPLPELSALAKKTGAVLMVDEAHATGVIGESGRGTEELFGMPGSVDVLMGTFSKAPGTIGGYICGDRDLITYLRFFARSSVFTATLPAALCVGVAEAYRIMQQEPQHRLRLWENVRELSGMLSDVGYRVPDDPVSAILPLFVGSERLLWSLSRDLFDAGIKCGNVAYPAVPRGQAILRLALNARHTREDLRRTSAVLEDIGRKYDILDRTAEEIVAIGARLTEDT